MKAGVIATSRSVRYGWGQKTSFHAVHFIPSIFLSFALLFLLAGCSGQTDVAPPVFVGTNYAAIATNSPTQGSPKVGSLELFFYPHGPKGANSLVWPYLTAQDAVVFDKLVVFNGGLSDDLLWKYFPALLAYDGNGAVVEISRLASRKIPGWQPYWTNYSFTVLATSNQFVRLDAGQTQALDNNQPNRLEVDLDKAEISRALLAAKTNGEAHVFKGVKYLVAP
ncbi:MAG TPA: hypothetical protein VFB72_10210 [Verrucomicrobiae bacterium]|nr:hypothetical protein [Verrucomicrobiae bacterium]